MSEESKKLEGEVKSLDDEGTDYLDLELKELRRLAEQMRLNVESRSRSPQWLINSLNRIASTQNIEEVEPGLKYGKRVVYE